MAGKADVKRILSKGLTGLEAAKLILQDNVEVDHDREGLLSKADIQRIKASLTSPQDIADYNRWMRVYQLVDYSLKEARIAGLEAQTSLLHAMRILEDYHLEQQVRLSLYSLPAVVTEKQLQDLKARQRASLLAKKESLYGLACSIQDEEEDSFPSQALQELLPMMRDGRISPVLLPEDAIQQLKDLKAGEQAHRDQVKEHPDTEDTIFWSESIERERKILEEAWPKTRPIQPEEMDVLEPPLPEDPTEEQERLFYYLYFSSQDLYDAGLLRDWIDEYKPDLDEETSARPADVMQSPYLAIIQDPSDFHLDERGHYKDTGLERLLKLSGYKEWDRLVQDAGEGGAADLLKILRERAADRIKIVLSVQAVVGAVSEITGVELGEDLERWLEELQAIVAAYNSYFTSTEIAKVGDESIQIHPPYYLGMPKLPQLKIGRLKPTAASLAYYKDRMAMALGDDWWKEAIETLDFKAQEEDSLAAALIKDMETVRKGLGHGKR